MAFIPIYILILFITIIIDFFAGIYIEKTTGKKKVYLLWLSIFSTCLVLFIFKYFNFFNDNFRSIALFFNLNYPVSILNVILPIGLSFHTFQSLSYVIEVYRGNQKAERNFGIYALYVMFYPQLVAGPIERPQNLLHQFYENHRFDYDRVKRGLLLMSFGFFKKVVIADRLGGMVNVVYSEPTMFSGATLGLATIFFAFQIYCDFSGYSNIAIGAAQVMGFKLMTNFNRPYFSKSVSEFWKRWHISLSSWFKDYLYISLGGNQVSAARRYLNVFVTFTASGLWHGANWTYVIWGALNGLYIILDLMTKTLTKTVTKTLKEKLFQDINLEISIPIKNSINIIITFCLICFSWIFFRATNLKDALFIVNKIFTDIFYNGSVLYFKNSLLKINNDIFDLAIAILCILLLICVEYKQRSKSIIDIILFKNTFFRWGFYVSFILIILFFGVFNKSYFIYFQF